MNRAILCVAMLSAGTAAVAQEEDAPEDAAAQVAGLVAEIEAELRCDIETHGEPRFDEFSNMWLIAFSVTGDDCNAAAQALADRGERLGASFYRRPNAREINGLANSIAVAVSRGFHCRVTIRGEPRFSEQSAYWSVSYSALGTDCEDAGRELSRRGRELQIVFIPMQAARTPLR